MTCTACTASTASAAGAPPAQPRPAPVPSAVLALLAALAVLAALAAGSGTAVAAGAEGIQQRQWELKAINAADAWKTTRGKGVTVAVLDTGVDATHPDLKGSVRGGKDLVGFGAERGDRAWARHGTSMAGIIAGHGHGPDRSEGMKGVAPEARILPVRVLLEDGDPERDKARRTRGDALADGIRWATDNGADIINLSLGDDSDSAHPEPREDAAIRYALRKGTVVVASAGNAGADGDHISYPAAYPGVIAVTAVDRNDARAAFSTRRWYATVAAPGKDVITTEPDRRYYEGWGTSAAAAAVSGAVALVRAAHPDLTPAQIKELISDTARNTPEGGRSDALGTGIVDPAAAIEMGTDLTARRLEAGGLPQDKRYFGAGPERKDDGGTGWLAPVAGICGVLLIGAALALLRGLRLRLRHGSFPA